MSKLSETTTPELENEIARVEEEGRQDRTKHGNREWHAEANKTGADSDEIAAERTLFNKRCQRRDKRLGELNAELEQREKANVESRLSDIAAAHQQAYGDVQEAAYALDTDAVDALEQQIDRYLDAAGNTRAKALEAAQLAKAHGQPSPGLSSVKATHVESLHDRLLKIAAKLTTPAENAGRDRTFFDVGREEIAGSRAESAA